MDDALVPVRRQSLSDAVFEQLRAQILSGRMEAGAPLPSERALCERLGVNRGALREALKRLEQARLVSIQHGGGTHVTDFRLTGGLDLLAPLLMTPEGTLDTAVARSVIEMRSALAPDIARLAATRAGPGPKAELHAAVAAMAEAQGDLPELQRLALRFWGAAVEGSGNVAYRLAYNTLHETYALCFELLTHALADELGDLAAYRAIAAAVERGDPKVAERRARALTQKGEAAMLPLIDALAGLEVPR